MGGLKSSSTRILTLIFASLYLQVLFILAFRPLITSFTNTRADYFLNKGNLPEAVRIFQKTFVLDHTNFSALLWCGYSYEEMERGKEAEELYDKALAHYPNRPEPYYFRAMLAMHQKKYRLAKTLLEQAPFDEKNFYSKRIENYKKQMNPI